MQLRIRNCIKYVILAAHVLHSTMTFSVMKCEHGCAVCGHAHYMHTHVSLISKQ